MFQLKITSEDDRYGEWASEWWNWVVSENPDRYLEHDPIIFLRANIDYEFVGDGNKRVNATTHLDMTKEKRICISEDTAIFFPVIESELNYGDPNPGDNKKILTTTYEMRHFVRKDSDMCGPVGATIRHGDEPPQKLVDDITEYRAESPPFDIVIPEDSFLKDKMEWTMKPGVFHAVTDGYWILIRSLPTSDKQYQIHFELMLQEPSTLQHTTY